MAVYLSLCGCVHANMNICMLVCVCICTCMSMCVGSNCMSSCVCQYDAVVCDGKLCASLRYTYQTAMCMPAPMSTYMSMDMLYVLPTCLFLLRGGEDSMCNVGNFCRVMHNSKLGRPLSVYLLLQKGTWVVPCPLSPLVLLLEQR